MNCKLGAIRLIDQIKLTIEGVEEDHYSLGLSLYNGSTLGKHFRHIFDFFNCLSVQCVNGHVDYCDRHRDEKLELDRLYALDQFTNLQERLLALDESQIVKVNADFELDSGERPTVTTSIGRELMYAYDHAVHHLAIVKIGLRDLYPHRKLNQELGVAASTLRHQKHTH